MPNKKRTNRTSTATGSSTAAGGGDAPRTSTPVREPERKPARSEGSGGDYLVPGGLAVALVIALIVYVRMGSSTPPEPPGGATTDATSGHAAIAGNAHAEPSRPSTPTPPPAPPGTRLDQEPAPQPPPSPPGAGDAINPTHPEPSTPDPRHGHFTLAEATAGMPPGNRLVADIVTNMGTFNCELMPDRAPNTVANFVGLARGRREFWDPVAGRWVARPYFDGTLFHRVIPDFMIQGGDILRSGRGGPGYEVADENVASHDEAGLLCMANHGPNTGGSQFFILEDPKPHLNGSYSVFGRCTPVSLVERIARVPRGQADRPTTPVIIQTVRIHR